jgi:hypothetical protein
MALWKPGDGVDHIELRRKRFAMQAATHCCGGEARQTCLSPE